MSMTSISEQRKNELREIFALLNKNKTGVITIQDLDTVMRQLGRRPSAAELQDMLEATSPGTDSNAVDFDRFCVLMVRAERDEQLRESFRRFDRNGDGLLSREELHQALEDTLEEEPDKDAFQAMMQEADPDGVGHINFARFSQLALKYHKNQ